MQYIEPNVVTIGIGLAASMGQFLLSSGTKGKRYVTENARVLMHQPIGGVQGSATEVKIQANLLMDMKRRMVELTAKQTGKTVEKIYKDSDRDHWFTANEAKDYGLVDHVVKSVQNVKAS
jgi:ATP-dependent Clp protease protease subunit